MEGLLIYANRLNQDYTGTFEKFKNDLEHKEIEIMQKKPINTAKRSKTHNSKWHQVRKNAGGIFHQIVKQSYNNILDEEERNRAQGLVTKYYHHIIQSQKC